jgi:PleD family two-component response regulator
LISIRKATEDLDRLDHAIKTVRETYLHAIASTSHYSVELDAADTRKLQSNLEVVRSLAEAAVHPEDWRAVQASFRGELRDHRDRCVVHLTKLRNEMKAAADAMEIFAENVVTRNEDHKEGLRDALGTLDAVLHEESLAKVRDALTQTKAQISASIERMEKEHHLIIAQLRDEIRSLHDQIDADRKAQLMDGATGVWNHQKLHSQMEQMLDQGETFCVLVVSIRNLKRLDQRHSPAVIEGGIKALLQRLGAMLGDDCMMGRWSEEVFAAILQIDSSAAISISRQVSQKLSGTYSVQENGMSRNIELQAVAGVIERQQGMEAATFHKKLAQMAEVLSSA